ncbi:STAS domain-containing protein [Streptomyces sp. NPDC050095]|uniref:STAS domain-containing protein n=1 Tax=unclassified Streptomyces TaxID=2593676 RepID=UPI003422801A
MVIEVRHEIGPATEPHLGRLLHGAIRSGGTAVLVDLRGVTHLGAGGLGVLCLARTLAQQHGLEFGFMGATSFFPEPASEGTESLGVVAVTQPGREEVAAFDGSADPDRDLGGPAQ